MIDFLVISTASFENKVCSASPTIEYSLDEVQQKINSFGELEEGWDFGRGSPSQREVIDKAQQVYLYGKSLDFEANAFPGVEGEINITFYWNDHTIEITVDNDLSLDLTHEVGIGADYEEVEYLENVSIGHVIYRLFLMRQGKIWKSSELSTWKDTTQTESDSRATLFQITRVVSQSLTLNVPNLPQRKEYVPT